MELITRNDQETKHLACDISRFLKPGDILGLVGDLGSGKTTFVQGLAAGLGIEQTILSPTYVLKRTYPFEKGVLDHIDLYRLEKPSDIYPLVPSTGSEESALTVIEWADKASNLLPRSTKFIYFRYLNPDERQLSLPPELTLPEQE